MHGVIYNVLPNAFNFFETCCFIYLFLISRKVFTKIHFNVIKTASIEGKVRWDCTHCTGPLPLLSRVHRCGSAARDPITPTPSPDSLVFHFPRGPCYYLLAGCLFDMGGGHGYWPIICSPHESATAAKTIFFISQCPQPKPATQFPPVISNKLYWLGSRVP